MSIVFGSKLLTSKSIHGQQDDDNNPSYGIKHLSKREKQLLHELERTRSEIVNELVQLGPSISSKDMGVWKETLADYESKVGLSHTYGTSIGMKRKPGKTSLMRKKQLQTSSVHSSPSRSLKKSTTLNQESTGTVKTGLDSLPILASNGDFAFNVKLRMQGPIQLPVINLPLVRTMSSTMSPDMKLGDTESSAVNHDTMNHTLSSMPSFMERTMSMNMGELDNYSRAFIQSYFDITDDQMDEIMFNSENILRAYDYETGMTVEEDFAPISVFASLRPAIGFGEGEFDSFDNTYTESRQVQSSSTTQRPAPSLQSAASTPMFPPIKMNRTQSLHSLKSAPQTKSMDYNQSMFEGSTRDKQGWGSTIMGRSGTLKSTPSKSKKRAHRRQAWGDTGPKIDPNSADGLRMELMKSIDNMQKHTTQVKQGIVNVQELVALSNPRARTFITMMAADQLCVVITRVGHRELRRGWDAWLLSIRNDTLKVKAAVYRHFQRLRRIAVLLGNLVLGVLRYNFMEWVKFSVSEKLRVEMEAKMAAAVTIQRIVRGNIGREKARKAAEGNKFLKLHAALVKIQSMFRCKIHHWRYLKYKRDKLEESSTLTMQRVVRGHLGRRRARRIRLYRDKESAAVLIQAFARGIKGRRIARDVKLLQLKNRVIIKIQALARGYIGRMRVGKILQDKLEAAAAIKIQARIRGAVARMNIHHRRKEIEEYRSERNRYATAIQAVYRGFRARIMFRYYMEEHNKFVALQNASAVVLQCMVRVFLARLRFQKLDSDRTIRWITNAQMWKEMWAEDSGTWFYMNDSTGEALWEPPAVGYTKSDGQLVLENGKIVDPPDTSGKGKRLAGQEHLCVECVTRVAIRQCNECGDGFCTKCYKETHASGSRKQHTYEAIGPLDCTECEEALAERWCISCDEAYCDACWRKVHSKGKRRYHPFSQVLEDGHVDSRIFTIDGEQVHNYDASYSQTRYEADMAAAAPPAQTEWAEEDYAQYDEYGAEAGYDDHQQEAGVQEYAYTEDSGASYGEEYAVEGYEASTEEWTVYYDDNNYPYWYNNFTGDSTYEDPTNG
mmetsp:Transcript_26383/g.39144  ORF Transcript_26383/g.39144 Transcript_26383/m.39144 type:complete len:1064 (+) Transcript_26383:160-3351(+)